MDHSQTHTSTTLLQQVAAGGNSAAETLFFERYGKMARAVALASGIQPNDADDLVQEAVMAAVGALREDAYRRERGRFKAWFKGVLRNKIGHLRRANRRHGVCGAGGSAGVASGSPIDGLPSADQGPDEAFEQAFDSEWQRLALAEAFDEIRHEVEPSTWQAFDLIVNKNRQPDEVAKLLGLTRNAVYVAKNRVLERARQKVAGLRG